MERMLLFGILAVFLFAGCVSPYEAEEIAEEGPAEELEPAPQLVEEEIISVSGNEDVRVVTIKAVGEEGRWDFQLSEYEDEFIGVGLHSDSFIRLNSSHFELLEDNEAFWLTPMIKTGNRTVLFNAVYSQDIDNCGQENVNIIGKDYELSKLGNGSSFEHDDKWKVALEYDDACLKRLVIYLDGYFYDLGDDETVNLFRSDNTVLFRFRELEGRPEVNVILTKPVNN
jgi:hypothetical protein